MHVQKSPIRMSYIAPKSEFTFELDGIRKEIYVKIIASFKKIYHKNSAIVPVCKSVELDFYRTYLVLPRPSVRPNHNPYPHLPHLILCMNKIWHFFHHNSHTKVYRKSLSKLTG